jgi:hypothetical protein
MLSGPSRDAITFAYVVPTEPSAKRPRGWKLLRSALPGYSVLERPLDVESGDPSMTDADPPSVARQELEEAGHEVRDVRNSSSSAADGAALVALIASGLVRDWGRYFRTESAA